MIGSDIIASIFAQISSSFYEEKQLAETAVKIQLSVFLEGLL